MPTIENLLIVKLSSMGDVIHTLPVVQALRAEYPQARISWAVERTHASLLKGLPFLDEAVVWDRGTVAHFVDFIRRLRQTKWDVAIDFQGLARSGLVTYLSGARRRVGFRPCRELAHWFYNEPVALTSLKKHAIERYLDLGAALGATVPQLPLVRPYLNDQWPRESQSNVDLFPLCPGAEERRAVELWLADHHFDAESQRLVILNPHCRRDANTWPVDHFVALGRRLLERPEIRIALCGGPVARSVCDAIAAQLGNAAWRADGKFSLLGSAELFRHAAVVVTGDTGPMHLAAAARAKIVAMIGPTSSLRTGPYANDAVVLDAHLSCAPCYKKVCPLGYDPPKCMNDIGPENVYRAVLHQLSVASDEPGQLRRTA